MNTQSLPNLPDTDEPTAVVIDVTPELARVWLRANTRNRNTRERAVTEYARDMVAGHWNLNGEAIKFAYDGSLLDGQHRLRAVIEADATVQMLVVVGLPRRRRKPWTPAASAPPPT